MAVRVLIIDDSRDGADSMQMVLDLKGYDTRVTYTGDDGLRVAADWCPDVVLCDLDMPGVTGYDVAKTLRACPGVSHTRLIAVSGYGQDEDRQRCRDAGFDAFLVKPVEWPELERILAGTRRDVG